MIRPVDLSPEEKNLIRGLLQQSTLPRDALPYSEEFPRLKEEYCRTFGRGVDEISDMDFWRLLADVGKSGGVRQPGMRKRAPRSPSLSKEEQLEILRLMPDGIGSRDNLPYTREFDRLQRQFTKLTANKLSKWDFWRVVSRLAKDTRRRPAPVFESVPSGSLKSKTAVILESLNQWWIAKPAKEPPFFRRWAFEEAWRLLGDEQVPIVSIRGSRRVGKSTILDQIIEQLLKLERVPPKRILYVQFDELPGLGVLSDPILSIVKWFEENVLGMTLNESAQQGDPAYLFFDELQNLKDWAPQLKSLADHNSARILVTGSSSLRILQGRDSLAGRLSMIELGPLRLSEIAGIRRLGKWPEIKNGPGIASWAEPDFWLGVASQDRVELKILRETFRHFSEVGGYPVCHARRNTSKAELAKDVTSVVVDRTIEHDQPVDPQSRRSCDRLLLKETFRLLCRYAGENLTTDRICEEVNSVLSAQYSAAKVDDAIQFMVDAMLVHRIEPLEALRKRRNKGAKYCLCDHFIREAWLQEKIPLDPEQLSKATESVATLAGHLIESTIGYFFSSIPGLDVAWLPERTNEHQPEIDFVLTIGLKRIPIEVKYVRRKLKKDDYAGLERFCLQKKYNASFGLIVTQKEVGQISDSVIAVPASALLSIL